MSLILMSLLAVIAGQATYGSPGVCSPGYSSQHRLVTTAMKTAVYVRDGVPRSARGGWIIDHYIPLEIGGTNALSNLKAQPKAEARLKDRDENRLHREVCKGRLTLAQAQAEMRRKWKR